MNRFLTVASSGLIATGLAILPTGAFAQSTVAPAKTAAPVMPTTTTTTPATQTPAMSTSAQTPAVLNSAQAPATPHSAQTPAMVNSAQTPATPHSAQATTSKVDAMPKSDVTTKSDVKSPAVGTKTDTKTDTKAGKSELHGMNSVKTHHAAVKTAAPVAPTKG